MASQTREVTYAPPWTTIAPNGTVAVKDAWGKRPVAKVLVTQLHRDR
jgi:hypothetical protein